jgi:type II secretory pathway pseudopilin PulG
MVISCAFCVLFVSLVFGSRSRWAKPDRGHPSLKRRGIKAPGFSLIELLFALAISFIVCLMTFQLFHQNERAVRDQTLIIEMQETARVVASQIADEVRMAGQGVPMYASSFDTSPSEAVAPILRSSTSNRIDFRASLSNVETVTTTATPFDLSLGVSKTLWVAETTGFAIGKYVYISTYSDWVRAVVTNVTWDKLTIIPRQTGTTNTTVRFGAPPSVSQEEAVSIYLTAGSLRRATAEDTTNPAYPIWSPANEIGKNVRSLSFTYYDANGQLTFPTSLANRLRIARVDVSITVETAGPLTNGTYRTYSVALRTIPRNVRIRSLN